MTNLLTAATVDAVDVDDCTAFSLFGEGKIIALLGSEEYVKLYEEEPGGTYIPVIDSNGIGIVLTKEQPSRIIVGYGNYKISKTATALAVNVGLEN